MILVIRTDKQEAEIGLFFDTGQKRAYETWQAHRELSKMIHSKIDELLRSQEIGWSDLSGVVCFTGPGSFTGLRIGLTVGDALANSFDLPIVGTQGEEWMQDGIKRLQNKQNDTVVLPDYGRDAHITQPKK